MGRFWLNRLGMWICSASLAFFPKSREWRAPDGAAPSKPLGRRWQSRAACLAQLCHFGICRFCWDVGYAVGPLGLRIALHSGRALEGPFWFAAALMLLSFAGLWIWSERGIRGWRRGGGG